METPSTVSKQPRIIPRYVRDLNELAELHGIATSTLFAPDDDSAEIRLWANWRGVCPQLQSVGLLARHQLARLMWLPPRFTLTVPSGEPRWCHRLLHGEIEVTGDVFEWRLNFGPGEFSVTDRGWGDVEAVTYVEEILLYGSAEALIRAGVDRTRLPLGKRAAKSSGCTDDEPWWCSRRVPNGMYLYRQEHGTSAPPVRTHLRLVVDNTVREDVGRTRLG
jgi:hypothetical protein